MIGTVYICLFMVPEVNIKSFVIVEVEIALFTWTKVPPTRYDLEFLKTHPEWARASVLVSNSYLPHVQSA